MVSGGGSGEELTRCVQLLVYIYALAHYRNQTPLCHVVNPVYTYHQKSSATVNSGYIDGNRKREFLELISAVQHDGIDVLDQ